SLAFAVQLSHPTDVSYKMAVLDELRQDELRQGRWIRTGHIHGRFDRFRELLRHDYVRKAERGEQNLAERAKVNHPVAIVEPVQRRQRLADIPEFAVVIVLDDPAAGASSPL